MRETHEAELKEAKKVISELLCWIYPWKTTRRSKEFIEEAMRGYQVIGRRHPFQNVAHIEKKLGWRTDRCTKQ